MKYFATIEGKEYVIDILQDKIVVNDQSIDVDFKDLSERGMVSLLLGNRSIEAVVEERDDNYEVLIQGELYSVQVQDERSRRLALARGEVGTDTGELQIKSPMPGIIIATPAAEGSWVKKGDQIIILESMKMENELRSPRDGVLSRVLVSPGLSVEKDQVLAIISDEDDEGEG